MGNYKFIKSKELAMEEGYYFITPLINLIPNNIGVFVKTNGKSIYLQTSYITDDQAQGIKLLMGDLFEEIVNVELDASQVSNNKTGQSAKAIIKQPENIYNYGWVNSPTGLYIRNLPNLQDGGRAGVLDAGQRFKIDNTFINDEWVKIVEPIAGYIYKEYTSYSYTPKIISQRLVDFTASWEGFSSTPYRDAGGNWTVGFGDCTYNVEPSPVTYQEAWNTLESTLNTLATQVYEITKDMDLNQAQFDSLVDFAYNLGINALTYSEDTNGLVRAILECNNNQVILNDFTAWDNCDGQQLLGLKRRRIAESQMFLASQYNKN